MRNKNIAVSAAFFFMGIAGPAAAEPPSADMTVLPGNLFAIDQEVILPTEAANTVLGGKIV